MADTYKAENGMLVVERVTSSNFDYEHLLRIRASLQARIDEIDLLIAEAKKLDLDKDTNDKQS